MNTLIKILVSIMLFWAVCFIYGCDHSILPDATKSAINYIYKHVGIKWKNLFAKRAIMNLGILEKWCFPCVQNVRATTPSVYGVLHLK